MIIIAASFFIVFSLFFIIIPLHFGTLKNVWIAIDQLINAYFKGWPDETISSRSWRWEKSGKRSWPRKVIDTLFFFDKNHCFNSYESERLGRQLPPEFRENVDKLQ